MTVVQVAPWSIPRSPFRRGRSTSDIGSCGGKKTDAPTLAARRDSARSASTHVKATDPADSSGLERSFERRHRSDVWSWAGRETWFAYSRRVSSGQPDVVVAEPTRPSRPRSVTAVVVLTLLQAAFILLVGLALVLAASSVDMGDEVDLTPSELQIVGGVVIAVGLVEAVLSVLLARGSEKARSVFGAIQTVHVATAVYALIALRDVALQGIWGLALSVLVLWLLYGSDQVAGFFHR